MNIRTLLLAFALPLAAAAQQGINNLKIGGSSSEIVSTATVTNNGTLLNGSSGLINLSTGTVTFRAALEAIEQLTPAADRYPYFTSSSAAALGTITSFARSLLDDADAESMRATLDIAGNGGGGTWGSITGTLSAQTDLQSALDLKANLISPSFTTPSLGVASGTSLTLSSLTSGRVAIVTTSGQVTDDAGLVYDATTDALTVGGTVDVTNNITAGGYVQIGGRYRITGNGSTPSSSEIAFGTNSAGTRAVFNVPTGGQHNFNVNGSPVVAVTSDMVQIGTGTGAYKLTVFGGDIALDRTQKLQFAGPVVGDTNRAYIGGDSSTNSLHFGTGGAVETMTLLATGAGTQGQLRLPSISDFHLYNTVDQTTNYERLRVYWSGNEANIATESGGTGQVRQFNLGNSAASMAFRNGGNTGGLFSFFGSSYSTAGGIGFRFAGITSTATSGTNVGLALLPTYNQASGTAANTDFLINRTETAVGSGAQNLIDAQVGGASRFSANTGGGVTAVRASAYSAGAGASFSAFSNDGVNQITSGARIGQFSIGGRNAGSNSATAIMAGFATETWVDSTSLGTKLQFQTTPTGSATRAATLDISGGAAATITGGAGNMTITSGTGNSRTMALQTTTSVGTATTWVSADDTQKATFPKQVVVSQNPLVGNLDLSSVGPMVVVGTDAGAFGEYAVRTYNGGAPQFAGRTANGTLTSPTATTAGQALVRMTGNGYGTTGYVVGSLFGIFANQNFTDSAAGTNFQVQLQPDGSTTRTTIATIAPAGSAFTHAMNASSGTDVGISIANTYNQTGTAGSVDFKINRTNTAVGSGSHKLMQLQVAGVDKFQVFGSGQAELASTTGSSFMRMTTADAANVSTTQYQNSGASGRNFSIGTAGSTYATSTLRNRLFFFDDTAAGLLGYFSAGGGFTTLGTITAPAATTSIASFNAPHGTAPSSPTNGDIWTTTSGLYVRVNGSTVGPLGSGGSGTEVTAASTFGTDNVLLRSDGTSRGSQSTGISVDDSNNVSGINDLSLAGAFSPSSFLISGNAFSFTSSAPGTVAFGAGGTVLYSGGAISGTTGTFTSTTSLLLGTAGSAVGNIGFRNATSGTATLAPPTGALGTYTVTLPNAASTLPIYTQQITYAGPTAARTVTYPDANFTVARTDAGNTFTGASTASAWVLTSPTITTGIEPTTNDGAALGTTSKQFSDLFLAEGGVINFDNGDATITQVGDVVTVAGADLKVTTPGTASTSVATIDGTQTLTNKTIDGASNVVKLKGYLYLTHPHLADGTGATIGTTATAIDYGHATFTNSTDKATNYVEYRISVPEDIDTSVEIQAQLKFRLTGADTNGHRYVLSCVSQADSASATGTPTTEINLDFAGDASGASGDVETVGYTTLTGWAATLTAGQLWVVRLARDGDTSDASTVNSTELGLVLKYGITQ